MQVPNPDNEEEMVEAKAGMAPWHPIEVAVPLWTGFTYRDPAPKMGEGGP